MIPIRKVTLSLSLAGVLLLTLFATMVLASSPPTMAIIKTADGGVILINELDADQDSTDAAEFIELYDGGAGNTSLDGLVLVLYNGNGDVSYEAFDLDTFTTNANGYFVLCGDALNVPNCDLDVMPDTNLIQNGADAAALYLGNGTDFPVGTAVTTTNLLDAIVYGTDDADDPGLLVLLNASQPQVNENSNSNGISESNQRCPDGGGGALNTEPYIQAAPTAGAANNCPAPYIDISKSAPVIMAPNDLYTYTLTVENQLGYTLNAPMITDLVPSNVTFAYALDGGLPVANGADTQVVWLVPNILDQGSVTVRFAVTASDAITTIINSSYGISATNYLTVTYGDPLLTFVNPPLRIHDIQGEEHFSPFAGLTVSDIPGIVTVVRSNSFYMQDPNPDGNDSTSEGISVFTGGAPGTNVGDFVIVTGNVDEFYPGGIGSGNLSTTQLSNPTIIISSTNNALPMPTIIGTNGRIPPNSIIDDDSFAIFDPTNDGIDFYESLEGMLVQVENAIVVGHKRFDEIAIVGDSGANATGLNARGSIAISSGDFNPERILIDDAIVINEPFAETGYAFTDIITGVMDYSFGNFKLLNPEPLPALTPGGLVSETSELSATADHLIVASFNVLNLDPGDNTFITLADEIVNHLNAPDIIGLAEIQDNNGEVNDGTTDASLTYNTLIDAIINASGPTYQFRDITPENNMDGGAPGGNIRVGFLFRPDRVTFVDRAGGTATNSTIPQIGPGGVQLTYSPGRIQPTATAFLNSRKPLVGEFNFNDQSVFVVVNHFNSKGGDEPLFGNNQPPILNSETQRIQQAQIVNDFVDSIQALDSNAKVIVLGDLNDFQFSLPLLTLQAGVLVDLIDTLPATEQYTYIFDGNAQVLDHILATDNLASMAEVDVVHVNTEFDESRRPSDHDPVLARFNMTIVPDVAPTAVSLTGPTTGTINTVYTFTAAVSPLSTTLPITFTWKAAEQVPVTHLLSDTSDTLSYSWVTTGTKIMTVTAENSIGSVNSMHTIVITTSPPANFDIYLPAIVTNSTAFMTDWTVESKSYIFVSLALFPTIFGLGWLPIWRKLHFLADVPSSYYHSSHETTDSNYRHPQRGSSRDD